MINCRLIVLLLFSWIAFQANAQGVYTIDTQYPVHELKNHLVLVNDESKSLTPEQVLTDSTLTFFVQDEEMRYLRIGEIYWGKISLLTVDSLKGWTLNFEDRLRGLPAWSRSNGQVDVYGFSEDKLIFHKKTGVEYPKSEREVKDNWILNRIYLDDLPINSPIELIIRVTGNSIGYPPYFNATLRGPGQSYYHELFAFNESFNIFMLGLTFIIFLYHLLQFVYLRQRIFLWFSIWVLFCTLTMAMSVGFIIGDFHNYRLPIWMFIANGVLYSLNLATK